MYKEFVDTTEAPPAEEMPAEALKLNGDYIENLMDARYCTYRTLYVKGREALSPELSSYTTGVHDGSVFQSKRFPARTITVGYSLKANSNYYFRMAFNEINRILNVEDAEIIFYDEQDKYFTGTPSGLGEVPPGTNFVTGEFTIFCPDPFKYSVAEYEVEPTEDNGTTFVINYEGTYKCFPTLESTFAEENECGATGSSNTGVDSDADCGYVAWFNEDAKIIQLGDPEEENGESYDESQTLFSQDFREVSGWTSALSSIWTQNYNMYVGVSDSLGCVITGTPGFPMMNSSEHYMGATSFGSPGSNKWYGPTISRTLPADATGETEASDWTLKWWQKLCIGSGTSANAQRGAVQVIVTDANDNVIAAANMFKGANDAGSTGEIWFNVNSGTGRPSKTTKKFTDIDFSYRNARWGANASDGSFKSVKACSIVKEGKTVKFNLGGTTWSFTDAGLADLKAKRVTFTFLARTPYDTLAYMGVYKVTFTKNNCETWRDIPNKFTCNDVATAECKSGTVLLNGAESPEYGALGNNWEDFYLKPGINQIGFSWSDWCVKPPTTKMRYREVFL